MRREYLFIISKVCTSIFQIYFKNINFLSSSVKIKITKFLTAMEYIPPRGPGKNWNPKILSKLRSDLFGFVPHTLAYGVSSNGLNNFSLLFTY